MSIPVEIYFQTLGVEDKLGSCFHRRWLVRWCHINFVTSECCCDGVEFLQLYKSNGIVIAFRVEFSDNLESTLIGCGLMPWRKSRVICLELLFPAIVFVYVYFSLRDKSVKSVNGGGVSGFMALWAYGTPAVKLRGRMSAKNSGRKNGRKEKRNRNS